MTPKTWTCTITNGTTDAVQADGGLNLIGGTPAAPAPAWSLAPGANTTLLCLKDDTQRNPMTGSLTWTGPGGTTTLTWSVPYSGTPTYSTTGSGSYSATTGDGATENSVAFSLAGGTASAATGSTPPLGTPTGVTPTSGATTIKKPNLLELWMLADPDGNGIPCYNQGACSDPAVDWFPPKNANKSPYTGSARTFPPSGCALCALTSILGAYDCRVPTKWIPMTTQPMQNTSGQPMNGMFLDGADNASSLRTPNGPATMLHFLWDYIVSTDTSGTIRTRDAAKVDIDNGILAGNPAGAIRYNATLAGAVNFLFTFHPRRCDPSGKLLSPDQRPPLTPLAFSASQPGAAEGAEIDGITRSICVEHKPVVTGVGSASGGAPEHVVLAVGVARYGGKTYYVNTNSGFGPMDPSPRLLKAGAPSWDVAKLFTVSSQASSARADKNKIYWYVTYSGLDEFDLTLNCKQVKVW